MRNITRWTKEEIKILEPFLSEIKEGRVTKDITERAKKLLKGRTYAAVNFKLRVLSLKGAPENITSLSTEALIFARRELSNSENPANTAIQLAQFLNCSSNTLLSYYYSKKSPMWNTGITNHSKQTKSSTRNKVRNEKSKKKNIFKRFWLWVLSIFS